MAYNADVVKKTNDDVVRVEDVSFSYDSKQGTVIALQNINLNIQQGEFICILGPSGCGKSTLLNLIAGFFRPSYGNIMMENHTINGPDWKRGVVFQLPNLYPWLNIWENIAFGLKMRHFTKKEINERVNTYINLVELSQFKNHKPYELSGGMKQRASLARVLVGEPYMILMDEPFGALDALTRQNIQALVRNIWLEKHNTVFLITHDVDEALTLASRTLVMSSRPGRIVKEFQLDFTYNMNKPEGSKVMYSQKYIAIREEILSIINDQRDQNILS